MRGNGKFQGAPGAGRLLRLSRLALSAVALIGVLALSACGSNGGTDDQDQKSGAGAAVGANGLPDLSGTTITYLGFGGPVDEAFKAGMFAKFEEETGAKILMESPTNYSKIETQVKSGNVTYDLVAGDPYVMDPGCGEFWAEVHVAMNAVPQELKPGSKCSVPSEQYFYQVAYNTDDFSQQQPDSCKDFFDTEEFPGKRLVNSYYVTGIWECAAIAAGADPHDPYPIDIPAATKEFESIKGDLVVQEANATEIEEMENGEVAMALTASDEISKAVEGGAPFEVMPDFLVRGYGSFGIPKGAPDQEATEVFLNWVMKPENNGLWLAKLGGPAGNVTEPIKINNPGNVLPEQLLKNDEEVTLNWDWWAEHAQEVGEIWSELATG